MIQDIVDTISVIARDKGVNVTIDELNILLNNANMELFRNLFGYVKTGHKEEISKEITHALAPFKTKTVLTFVNGETTLPEDYFTYARFDYRYQNQYRRKIDFVTSKEAEDSFASFILHPTELFPRLEIVGNKLKVEPPTVTSVDMYYYRYPNKVVYTEKIEDGINVFDADNSVDFEYPESFKIDILRLLCIYLGLQINDSGLIQYLEMKNQSEQ